MEKQGRKAFKVFVMPCDTCPPGAGRYQAFSNTDKIISSN